MQGTVIERQCGAAPAAVEGGMPLDQALALGGFPDSFTAFIAWGQRKACVAEAFREVAEVFEGRANSQSSLLNVLVPPVIYMILITFIGFTILALMMPLMSMMFCLSGG